VHGDTPAESLLASPYTVAPLRAHDGPPVTDGAACVILATGDRARALTKRPAWIRGIEHRVESQGLGLRDLTRSVSTELAAKASGALDAKPQVAEIYAPYSHQEILVARALGLGDEVIVNPSGGALASHPYMSAGLVRLGEAARRVMDGTAKRAVAHATSGPCLQQNLVCVLGDEP
jgi:acetyl-CoA acetyltransferase